MSTATSAEQNARLLRLTSTASVATAVLLILVKAGAWVLTDSVALLASLIDSMMDSAASLINLLAIRYALVPADDEHRFGHGSLTWDALNSSSVIAFRNTSGDGERTLLVVTNVGDSPVTLPEGDVLISSGPLADDGSLPSDTTAWVRLPVA